MKKKATKFFPQQEAICLAEEENTTDELIESLIESVEYVVQHFKDKVNIMLKDDVSFYLFFSGACQECDSMPIHSLILLSLFIDEAFNCIFDQSVRTTYTLYTSAVIMVYCTVIRRNQSCLHTIQAGLIWYWMSFVIRVMDRTGLCSTTSGSSLTILR